MTEKIWYIYKITCAVNGKGYIGLTSQAGRLRWAQHKSDAKRGVDTILYRAMRKHGIENFSYEVISECYSSLEACVCERALIAAHGTYAPRSNEKGNGYNATTGGERAFEFIPETRARMSRSAKSPETIAKKNTPRSKEARAKMAAWCLGKVVKESTKEKIRQYWKDQAADGKSRTRSLESRIKQSDTMKKNKAYLRLLKETSKETIQ